MANRHYHLKYHITNDADIIARLDAQESIQGYIRRLIQTDILADSLKGVFKIEDRYLDTDSVKPEIDEDMNEFNRRRDLMNRFCHGTGADNDDPDYCYSCIWSYQPNDALGTDVIRCQFEGLNADEMEDLILRRHKRIMNQLYGETIRNGEQL